MVVRRVTYRTNTMDADVRNLRIKLLEEVGLAVEFGKVPAIIVTVFSADHQPV
jgi:hypothetical protein